MKKTLLPTLRTNRLLFILALIGILIAAYVTQSFLRGSPIVCVNTGCELVRKSPASRLFGAIPVPAVGLLGYTILALCAFLKTLNPLPRTSHLLSRIMIGVALFGVAFVTWFTYTELFIIKGVCTWCAVSAINMVIICYLTIKNYRYETHQ